MSLENVEVVRRMLQAFTDGGLAAMAEFWDPDIDWRAAEGALDDVGEMHGPVAVRRYIQDWIDTFDDFSVVAEELRDVADDRVLAIQRLNGRAKLSGTETDLRYAVVNTVRDGKVVRGREYLSLDQALEAVGLRELAMSQENVELVRESSPVGTKATARLVDHQAPWNSKRSRR